MTVVNTYRAAAIGRTGRGNYGHGLDLPWVGLPGVEYVAVADDDEAGLQAAGERTGAQRLYRDYQEMLDREQPDFVSVCPRWTDCHAEMVLACAEAGVRGVFVEKPMARSLAECDSMLKGCERAGTALAVAHGRRFDHWPHRLRSLLVSGRIGQLRLIAGTGTADRRGGAEDLMTLGTHVLDLMRLLAGDVEWAWGRVTTNGHDLGPTDVIDGAEGMGASGGDFVLAHYAFNNGISGTFESWKNQGRNVPLFGLTLYGTEGILSFRGAGGGDSVHFLASTALVPGNNADWEELDGDSVEIPNDAPATCTRSDLTNNQKQALDLIAAVEEKREPVSNGAHARASLEMIAAVTESHRVGQRVPFPLANRENPFVTLRHNK